ncbi:hypothetical protein PBY51_004537 [Eleginops maclovinus]|uniref:Uncharacterized protein n=1 Tax=Eleginops maclovinus TaxID=56733 RepID=A0AAN7Y297_ELEMC|nr:hypothetical protein PBY51_004537 [Eleginops maclovinus]
MPPHWLRLVQGSINPSASLQPFSSNYKSSVAPEDLRPSKYGDYAAASGGATPSAELFIGMRCLLTVCVSICRPAEQTRLQLSVQATLETWLAQQRSDIILRFHGTFKHSDNSQVCRDA